MTSLTISHLDAQKSMNKAAKFVLNLLTGFLLLLSLALFIIVEIVSLMPAAGVVLSGAIDILLVALRWKIAHPDLAIAAGVAVVTLALILVGPAVLWLAKLCGCRPAAKHLRSLITRRKDNQ